MIKNVRAVGSGHWRRQCKPMRSIGKYSGALPRSLKNQAANDKPAPIRSIGVTRGAFGPDAGASYVLVLPKLAGPIHAIAFMGKFLRQERI
jgi:hypothetical protein